MEKSEQRLVEDIDEIDLEEMIEKDPCTFRISTDLDIEGFKNYKVCTLPSIRGGHSSSYSDYDGACKPNECPHYKTYIMTKLMYKKMMQE